MFRCLMGMKQGFPLSPMLFGLYGGLEKHLLDMSDIDAPTLMGVMVPLLLYADDGQGAYGPLLCEGKPQGRVRRSE